LGNWRSWRAWGKRQG